MSYNEFTEWQVYYNEEPFLADRLEMQIAKLGYTNLFTGMSKVDVEFEYFLASKYDKEPNKQDHKKLEKNLASVFGVKLDGTDDDR